MAASTSLVPKNNIPDATGSPDNIPNTYLIHSINEDQPINTFSRSIGVVVQRSHRRFFLRPLMLSVSTAGGDVIKELREIRDQELSRFRIWKTIRQVMWCTVIEIASISTFRLADVEGHPSPDLVEVIVSSRTPSPELTAAFHHSRLLHSSPSFVDQYPSLLSSSPSRTALLIGQDLNNCAIFWLLFAALLISIIVGLVVGFVCSRADLAVAVTAGLTGVISVFAALLIWMLK